MKKPRIMFYHDGRHPLLYMYEPTMQKEECEAAVDELSWHSCRSTDVLLGGWTDDAT